MAHCFLVQAGATTVISLVKQEFAHKLAIVAYAWQRCQNLFHKPQLKHIMVYHNI